MTEARGRSTESGLDPPLTIDPRILAEIRGLHDGGQTMLAWQRATAMAPLSTWRGTAQRLLSMRLLQATGAPRKASRMAIEAFRADRADPEARFFMGLETLRRRGPLSALEFARLYACDTAEWRVLEARVLLQLRDFEGADRALSRAEAQRPEDPGIRVERASYFEAQDCYPDALAVAQEALSRAPDSLAALHLTAHILQLQNRDEEALALLAAASERLENASLVGRMASIQTDLERHAEARASYERMIELSPEMELRFAQWLCARRSDAAYLCGDVDAAIELARASQNGFHLQVAPRMEKERTGRRIQLPTRFVRQHHMTCVPATLSAISELWRMPADHLQIAEAICYDGTSNPSERRWAERNGFRVREFTVTWQAAKTLLDRGVAFSLATLEPGNGHMQAVIGYDDRRGVLLVRDPFVRSIVEIDAESGLKHWAATGPRGMALVPVAQAAILEDLDLPDGAEREMLFAVDSALQAHDRPVAAEALHQLEARSPGHPITIQARRALANYDGDHQQLLECAEALLLLFPQDVNLLLGRISALRQLGRRAACLEALQERTDPKRGGDPLLWIELAVELRLDARKHAEAADLLRRAIRWRHAAGAAWHCLADLRWEEGLREEALELYRLASCLEDKHEGHASSYFLAARALDRTDDALRMLRDRFQRFGAKSSQPACTLFGALDGLRRGHEAFALLDRALELRPDDFNLLLFCADRNARIGQMEKAQVLLERAGAISRGVPWHRAAATLAEYRCEQEAALAHWRAVLATEPLAVDAHESVARLLAQTRGEDDARAHLQSACARFPHHYQLRQMWLGHLRSGDPVRAVEVARTLVEHHPSDSWARRELALLLQKVGRSDEAFAEMDTASRLDPRSASTFNVRGMLLENTHRTEEAREQYRASLRLEVDQPWAIAALLRLCSGAADRRRELQVLQDELRRQAIPGNALLEFQREARGVLPDEEILSALRSTQEARAEVWEAWSASIRQLLHMGKSDDALELARAATERFPLVPGAFRDLAAVHAERRERGAQKAALEKALPLARGWSEPARLLAELYEAEKNFAGAREILERAVAASPLDATAHGHLAYVLWQLGEKEKAIDRMRHALDLEPDSEWGWARLREWKADAAGFASELARKKPWSASAWLAVARTAVNLTDRLEALGQAKERQPRRIEIHDMLATMLAENGRFDEAAVACRPQWLGQPPPVALRGREAWILGQRGKRKEAIEAMRELCVVERDYRWGLSQLIELYREEKDARGMIESATQAIALEPKAAYLHGVIGEAHLMLHDRGQAKAALQRAIDLDPAYGWAGLTLFDEQLADGEGDAAAVTLARIESHCPSPFVTARAVQLAARQRDRAATAKRLAEVCATPHDSDWPVDAAVQAVAATPWSDVLQRVLSAAVEQPHSHPQVGAAWLQHVGGRMFFPRLWRELSRLGSCGAAGLRATEAYLRQAKLVRTGLFIACHSSWLREQISLWALAGYALVARGRYRRARRWLADYRARAPQPWMMINVIAAFQAGPGTAEADSAVEFACALPGAQEESKLRLWNAFRLAVAGTAPPLEPTPEDEFWLFLHRVTRAAATSADGVPDRKAAFRDSRKILAEATSPYFNRRLGTLRKALHTRAAARIARARGGMVAMLWESMQRLRT